MTTYRDLRPGDALDGTSSTALILANDGETLRYVYVRSRGSSLGLLEPRELTLREIGGDRELELHWTVVRC